MGLSRRMFTKEFKLAAVQRLERGALIGEVARALEVNPNVLHRWRREIRQGPGNVFPGHGKQRWADGRIAELERKIGQQALEIDFLKGFCPLIWTTSWTLPRSCTYRSIWRLRGLRSGAGLSTRLALGAARYGSCRP